ncbi:O-antigen ligase family protein [Sphingomonas sp. BE138]|uniref:O-antigen ligase family protein n=1 Tax=Sphingomonas sp. BE138 TaxID=2817845 RepID=UPI00286C082F|nr:O-antigen ligase family protein [Sphingomonas sp. BE138]
MNDAVALPSPSAFRSSVRRDDAVPMWLGLAGGFVLPMIAAALYATYEISMRSPWLEQTRQLGYVWLLGELLLILHAARRGFTVRAVWATLPRWVRTSLALFLSTFWISSAFVSRHPDFSLGLTIGWALQLLFAAALAHLVATVPVARLAEVWRGFALGLAALALAIAVHFTWLPAALRGWEREIDWGNAIPGFISVRLFGSWCGAVLALLTGVAWRAEGDARRQRVLHLAIALAFGMMFWSGTRAALLGWLCVLPVAWVMAGRPRSYAMLTTLLAYLLAAAALAILLQPYGHPAFTFSDLFDPSINQSVDTFSSGRLTFWKSALAVSRGYPMLGSGAGSCWWLVPLDGHYHVQPHNALVQFLLNWGVIPTLPALALLAGGIWAAHRKAHAKRALLPFVLMLDCLLVMSLFDGMLHFAQFVMLIVACLAICLAPRGTSATLDR